MDFYGYDIGDPNFWYQSHPDLRKSAAEYGVNYHGSHFHGFSPLSHPQQFYNPHLRVSSPNPVPSNPSFYHHTSSNPPLPNHTIINGHSLPFQFPFSSQISQPMNHQPSQPTYYPQSQLYNPYVCLSTQQCHTQPSILPTKATTTPPIYPSSPVPQHDLFQPPETNLLDQVTYTQFSYTSLQLEDTKVAANADRSSPRDELTDASGPDLGWIDEIGKVPHGDQHYDADIVSATPLNLEPCLQMPDPETNGAIEVDLVCSLTPLFSLTTFKGKENIVSEKDFSSMKESTLGVCENAAEDSKVVNLDLSYMVTSAVMDESSFWDCLRKKGYTMLSMVNTNHDNCTKLLDDIFSMGCTKPLDILHRYDFHHKIAIEDYSKEEFLSIFIALVYDCCKFCPFKARRNVLWNMLEPNFAAMNISYIPLVNVKFGKTNLATCEVLKQNVSLLFARMWDHWHSKLTVETSLDDIEGDKELNVEFIDKTMDCLRNIMGCNIDLTNDKDALLSAQSQSVWVLPTQSSCHNMKRIIESHFICPNLSYIEICEVVAKVTNFSAVDYSSSCFILVSQNLFQVNILNSMSKYALLRSQFAISYVTLELLFVEFDKSGSMHVDSATKALGDSLLEYSHWIMEWAKEKPDWEKLLTSDSKLNKHVLVRNLIAHAQLNVEILLDEMGHTRILGLHVFLDEVDVRFLGLDLAIKYENHRRLSNKHFCVVLRYAITSTPKCRAFLQDSVTCKATLLRGLTILFSALGLVEFQNHNFSSSESRIIQCIMWINVIMEFADNIATSIQEVTSLRLLTVHLVLVLFVLLNCHLGVKLESAKHDSLVLKFLRAIILNCSHTLYEIQACVWLELLQLVGFFFNGDMYWNVLQSFMEFKLMILVKDTTNELSVWQDAVVKNHQRYLRKLNARYVALLTLREVISVEEFGQTVHLEVSSEEIVDFPKIISETYALWVFEVDKKVVLATLGVIKVMYLLPQEHQKELHEQVVAKKEVFDFRGLLQGYPHIGFNGNREREDTTELLLHNVHLFVALYRIRVTIVSMLYTIVADALCVFCSLTNGESNSITISWKSKLTGYSLCSIATQASTTVLLSIRASSLCWTLSSGCCKYILPLAGVYVNNLESILINHAEYNLVVWNNIMAGYFFTEDYTNQVGIALIFDGNNIITKSMEITKLVCDGNDLLHYFLQWGITLLILYFGFISLIFVHGCSWYYNMRISFDNIMALKALSVIHSGTLGKTIAVDLQGMRTCLISRGWNC